MWLDILLIALVATALLLAIRKIVRDRRRGKTCSCGCANCASAADCGDKR